MDSLKVILALVCFTIFSAFAGAIDYYTSSKDYQYKVLVDSELHYNSAENKADKLLALSMIKNVHMQGTDSSNVDATIKTFECIYNQTLERDISIKFNTVYKGCEQ